MPSTDRYQATKDAGRDSWDSWLAEHDVSVPATIEDAVKTAVTVWLNRHGEQLFREAITEAIHKATPDRAAA